MVGAVHNVGILKSIFIANIILVIFIPLIAFRIFAFQPFSISSTSMSPALKPGDYIFTNKFAYGYSRYSFPYPPDFSGRFLSAEPARGDIIVFQLPSDPSVSYVKRLVGLPSDDVQIINGVLHINSRAVMLEKLDNYDWDGGSKVSRYLETLPNGVSYEVLDILQASMPDNTKVFKVPSGHYFMLGDNRDNSTDSRFENFGFIPHENLVGRVSAIFFSDGGGFGSIRWNRMFRRP